MRGAKKLCIRLNEKRRRLGLLVFFFCRQINLYHICRRFLFGIYDFCVYLCGPNVGMTEHFADCINISTVGQLERGEGMTDKVKWRK